MNALKLSLLGTALLCAGLWTAACSKYESIDDCERTGPELCDGLDNDCDGQIDQKRFTCSDGSTVPWCACDSLGNYDCTDSPESLCVDDECQQGEQRFYDCPGGEQVPWCSCEDGQWMCMGSPEVQCRDASCDDGSDDLCEMMPPVCEESEILAIQDDCWVCVDPETCEPNPACEPGEEILYECPDGEMVPWCTCGEDGSMDCMGNPEWQCHDASCDDGSEPLCNMMPPVCEEWEILAYQNSCYECVNPITCQRSGEPGCENDMNCDLEDYCDPCATSSCPICEDCVAACLPHNCGGDDPLTLMCMAPRHECNAGLTSIIRNGCWVCVELDSCQPPDPCGGVTDLPATCPDFEQVPWCTCSDAGTWDCIDDPLSACRDSRCDDGTVPICDLMPPICDDDQILAYQDQCYLCVNPDTCLPFPSVSGIRTPPRPSLFLSPCNLVRVCVWHDLCSSGPRAISNQERRGHEQSTEETQGEEEQESAKASNDVLRPCGDPRWQFLG